MNGLLPSPPHIVLALAFRPIKPYMYTIASLFAYNIMSDDVINNQKKHVGYVS